jgi:hypothetical protein
MAGVALALVGTTAALPDTPPTEPPLPVAPGDESERRLAEFSFAMYVTLEVGVDPGAFSCAAPDEDDRSDTITCFALTPDGRVIVATTTSSDGTGVFDWALVSDHTITGDPTVTTTTELPPPPTSEGGSVPTNEADAAILSYGEGLNQGAEGTVADLIEFSEGTIRTVNEFAWDPATAIVTLDVTLNPTTVRDPDLVSWIVIQAVKVHWVRGQPFRAEGATLRPALTLVLSGTRYESDFDLMVRVADQLIARADWVAAARRN